jgi:hypothetical protein
MSNLKASLCSKLECTLFSQLAIFCATGFSMSLTAALVYDFRISEWF